MRSVSLLAAAFAPLATAHTVFTALFINNVHQGDGTCVRMAKQGNLATHPVSLNSNEMACGRDGQQPVAFTCPAPAGAKLTLLFRMWADGSQPGSIDKSHVGPMSIYLKKVSDMNTDSAAGPGWFKIWSEGYDAATKKWATEKLIANNGLLSVNLPPGLPAGYYLARHEIVTLQNVTNNKADPQFYVGCAQLFVQGLGTAASVPADKTVSIPGHLNPNDPALVFNPYTQNAATYPSFGPPLFFPSAASAGSNKAQSTLKQTSGVIPSDCLIKNANWCGREVPDYTNEAGCWTAAGNCWEQADQCYKTTPPSGHKGCKIWEEQKCNVIQNSCEAKRFSGPPNRGVKFADMDVNQLVPGAIPEAVNAGQNGEAVVVDGTTSSADEKASVDLTTSSLPTPTPAAEENGKEDERLALDPTLTEDESFFSVEPTSEPTGVQVEVPLTTVVLLPTLTSSLNPLPTPTSISQPAHPGRPCTGRRRRPRPGFPKHPRDF